MKPVTGAAFLFLFCLLTACGPEGYTRIDPGGEYVYSNPAWSPDGKTIVFSAYYEKLYTADWEKTRVK